ncbi:MAG: hypothetical protein QXV82_09360 [Ignisphaera sp.]
MVVVEKYYDPHGLLIENTGYTLREILEHPEYVRFRWFKPSELEIMKRWIYEYRFSGTYFFGYQLPRMLNPEIIGKVVDTLPEIITLTRFKVDCVLKRNGEVWICEVKDYLLTTSLSQPVIYSELYRKYVNPQAITKPILIYGESAPEIEEIANKLNIQCFNLHHPTTRKHLAELIK